MSKPAREQKRRLKRQEEDHDFLINVLENQMELDMEVINVTKLVRLGKKETGKT